MNKSIRKIRNGLSNRDVRFPNMGENLKDAQRYRKNKIKAYTEGFDEFKKMAIPIILNNKYFKYHPNINLYVDLTKSCNCDCSFCIAKVNFERHNGINKDIISILSNTIDLLGEICPSIQITGGEPTLFYEELIKIFELIRHKNIKKSVLNTNAFRLNDHVIDAIIKNDIDHINISRHHYNDDENYSIMKGGIDSNELSHCIKTIKNRVRLQCNLLGDKIDTYGEIMQFIAYAYHKVGVNNVSFSMLTPLPKNSFYKTSIITDVENNPIDVDKILSLIENDNRFEFEKYRGGVACYYEIWKFLAYEKPMTIMFKYSDNHWLEKADKDNELLPDIILHNDGTLSGSWCKDRKMISKYHPISGKETA